MRAVKTERKKHRSRSGTGREHKPMPQNSTQSSSRRTAFSSKWLKDPRRFSHTQLIVFALFFALVGGFLLYKSFALNPNLPGDVNNDNVVNVTDLSILLTNYNQNYPAADFNGDGIVSILDLSILLTNYNRTYTPPPPSSGGGAASVFISPTGNDSNSCTSSAPCKTVQRGYNVATAGQIIELAAGNYGAGGFINLQKQVTFRANGLVKFSDIEVRCTTNLTIEGMTSISIALLAGNNNLTVKGGKFGYGTYQTNVENDPVVIGNVGSCSSGTFSRNILLDGLTVGGYVYPNGDEGTAHTDCLQFYGGNDGVTLRNSTFDQCDDSYIGGYPDFGDVRNILIENNSFSRIEESSSYFYSQWGQPGHPYRCEFITWRGNTVHSNLPLRTECWDMTVENNTFDTPGPGDYNCQNWKQTWRSVWRNNTWLRGGGCTT